MLSEGSRRPQRAESKRSGRCQSSDGGALALQFRDPRDVLREHVEFEIHAGADAGDFQARDFVGVRDDPEGEVIGL